MRHIFLFLAVLCLPGFALAQNGKPEPEMVAMSTAMTHCVAPVFLGEDAAQAAVQAKLPEFPPEQAAKFLHEKEGRVFANMKAPGKVVLAVMDNGVCQVMVREMNAENFWDVMDRMFAPGNTPWTLVDEKREGSSMTKSYNTNQNGPVIAHISARDEPVPDGVQAVVTISRYKE